MKKSLIFGAIALLAVVSCQPKSNPDDPTPGKEVTVSISADAQFAADYTAKLTLTLSDVAEQDVNVTLAKAAVQSGKTEIPADFNKNVKIKKGEKTAVVEVSADGMGLEAGSYQAAIKIDKADGAKVADNAVVYINIDFVFKPTVNLIAPVTFPKECVAKLQVTLDKASATDTKVKLSITPDPILTATVAPEVTVPAGQTSAETDVTVTLPEALEAGSYPVVIKITEVENALVGPNSEVTINLAYPFSTDIVIDGNFDDWADPTLTTYTLPDGCIYQDMKVLKLAANGKYAYVYMEFTDVEDFSIGRPFDLFIDPDASAETGGTLSTFDNDTGGNPYRNYGLRWYLEISLHDGDHYQDFFSWGGLYRYDGNPGDNVFTGLNNISGTYDGSNIYAQGAYDASTHTGRIEAQFERKFFEMTGSKAAFGVKIMDGSNNWACLGILPQGTDTVVDSYSGRNVPAPVDMAVIYLPQYTE